MVWTIQNNLLWISQLRWIETLLADTLNSMLAGAMEDPRVAIGHQHDRVWPVNARLLLLLVIQHVFSVVDVDII